MNETEAQAKEVAAALRKFIADINAMLELLGDNKTVARDTREDLRARLTSLKSNLKAAATRGTVSPARTQQNEVERLYFSLTVSKASANCSARVNTHPINSNWLGCLLQIQSDISMPLGNLEQNYPDV